MGKDEAVGSEFTVDEGLAQGGEMKEDGVTALLGLMISDGGGGGGDRLNEECGLINLLQLGEGAGEFTSTERRGQISPKDARY